MSSVKIDFEIYDKIIDNINKKNERLNDSLKGDKMLIEAKGCDIDFIFQYKNSVQKIKKALTDYSVLLSKATKTMEQVERNLKKSDNI